MLVQRKSLTKRSFVIPKLLKELLEALLNLGAKPFFVGGCVRDFLLDIKTQDFDIEVYNIESIELLKKTLEKYSKVKIVGKNFGVIKLKIASFDCDFSLPRLENKIGKKHIDFEVILNSNLSFEEATKRRDFTINAILYDYFSDTFIDCFDGIADLKKTLIRHIDDKSFMEDSLRVFRAIQFASRFDFKIDEKTTKLCKQIALGNELPYLSKARIFEEFKKLFLKAKKISKGLEYLKEFSLFEVFIELKSINFEKTLKALDNLALILKNKDFDENRKLSLFFSCLCKTMESNLIEDFLNKILENKILIRSILELCKNFLSEKEDELKYLSFKLKLEDLLILNKSYGIKDSKKTLNLIRDFNILNKELKILVQGKDLINLGFMPNVRFKKILAFALDLQIKNNFTKEEILEEIQKTFN